MEILFTNPVFNGKNSHDQFAGFPGLCKLDEDHYLASFQVGPAKNHADVTAALVRSLDGGRTWNKPIMPFKAWAGANGWTVHLAYVAQVAPKRLLASLLLSDHRGDPALPFFHPATGGVLPIRLGLAESTDEGNTWTTPRLLNTGEFDSVPVPAMSPVIPMEDGSLLLGFETSKHYEDEKPWKHYAACLRSTDVGRTWNQVIKIANDPSGRVMYWDHRLAALDRNRCIDFFYAFDNEAGQELTAHCTLSVDGGRTWSSPPRDTGLRGQPWPIALGGDALAVAVVDRYGSHSIKLHLSPDLGKQWTEQLTVYRPHDARDENTNDLVDNLNSQQNWNYGLPSGLLAGPGEVMMIWYGEAEPGTRIECARIKI